MRINYKWNFILKTLLNIKNYQQKKFAYICDIPEYKMSKYCRGIQEPTIQELKTMAFLLGVTVDQLVGNDNNLNLLVFYRTKFGSLIPNIDSGSLETLINNKEIYKYDTKQYEEVIGIDLITKKVILKNSSVPFDTFNKEWTVVQNG